MAFSLVRGLLEAPEIGRKLDLHVADPQQAQLHRFAKLAVEVHTDNNIAITQTDVVVLAVKPQVAGQVVAGLDLMPHQLLVSIAAGINLASLQQWTRMDQPIVRCMPNTPALLNAGISALFASSSCSQEQRHHAQSILDSAGATLWVDDENQLDAVTAVSGSGPAYFFLLMEAMVEAGVGLGLSNEVATKLTLETARGAALMALDSSDGPAALRHNVTSPGGTTEAALRVLTDNKMSATISQALFAAATRSTQLAEEFGHSSGDRD